MAKCQIDKGYKDSTDTLVPYEFKKLPAVATGVVSDGNRVFVHAVIDSGIRARTLLGFYQFNGDMFTGLYVLNADGFSDAQVAKIAASIVEFGWTSQDAFEAPGAANVDSSATR